MISQPVEEISTLDQPPVTRRRSNAVFIIWACILLALGQMMWRGYQLGVGNQGIQITFLKALHDPRLFTRDIMVTKTLNQYPSWFFRFCAPLLQLTDVPTLYLAMHLLATAGTLLAVFVLCRSIFGDRPRSHWAALLAVFMLLAGQEPALAGETLYSEGLTHTWFVFPLTLLALAFFYRKRYWLAFGLAGVIFNLHALEAGYLLLLMTFVRACEILLPRRAESTARLGQLGRLMGTLGAFLIMALPTLVLMIRQRQGVFTTLWVDLMHVRSADHSFPSTWWQPGRPDVPIFLALIALAGVALGFGKRSPERTKTILLAAGVGMLFLAGYLFTEIWPVPIIIRAQLFRSSRILMVIALIVIANGCVSAWLLPFKKRRQPAAPDNLVADWRAILEFTCALLIAAVLIIPSLIPLLPLMLGLATIVAVINGRLAWYQALLAGIALLVCLLAWQRLQFMIPGLASPGLSAGMTWRGLFNFQGPPPLGWIVLLIGSGLWILARFSLAGWVRLYGAVLSACAVIGLLMVVFPSLLSAAPQDKDWLAVQLWAKKNTPVDALFMTPVQQSGFRIHSDRAIVGEWRDGTQLYFNADFTSVWWDRMKKLQDGMVLSVDQREVFNPGKQLWQFDDDQIISLAAFYDVQYVVLPTNAARGLEVAYSTENWTIYRPQIGTLAEGTGSDLGTAALQQDFMRQTVFPNIEKYRKSPVQIQVVDAGGRPPMGADFSAIEKKSAFGWGCSLPYFKSPDIDFGSDYKSPPVTPAQLKQFVDVFNYSVIPFSGNWSLMEPSNAVAADYSDLDQYVDWCAKNGISVEFSFLTGYEPAWYQKIKLKAERTRLVIDRAKVLLARYGKKIGSWQVMAEGIGDYPASTSNTSDDGRAELQRIFAALREAAPDAKLGIADDARFWSPFQDFKRDPQGIPPPTKNRSEDMLRGMDDLRSLRAHGVKVDFVSLEARQPIGLWADGKDIYETLNAYAKEGVRIHITQFGIPVGARMEGPFAHDAWTPELRARYYEQFFEICFSHPAVDAVNIYALASKQWLDGEGLLDNQDQPTPALIALKKLITKTLRTQATGNLDPAGMGQFTGFHGDYELKITLPSGKTVAAPLTVAPGAATHRYQLNAAGDALTEVH